MKEAANCLNCQTQLKAEDKFCPACGQENKNLRIGFWELIIEFLSSNFNFDTKLGRTLVDLLVKPGKITKQFVAGKRVRYVKPVQMYLFVSFVFFLLLGLDPASFVNKNPASTAQVEQLNNSGIAEISISQDELTAISNLIGSADPNNDAEIESALLKLGLTEIASWERHVMKQVIRSMKPENEDQLTKEVYANLSISMFFLLPFFAALIWLFTKSLAPFYMDALIFSLHFHSVAFILFSLDVLTGFVTDATLVTKLILFSAMFYLILAMKRVYSLKWRSSIGKTLGITAIYSIVLGFTFSGILILSFLIY